MKRDIAAFRINTIMCVVGFLGAWLCVTPLACAENKLPCAEDIAQFCKDVRPGGGRIIACLNEHEKELSSDCRSKLAELRYKIDEAKKVCAEDIEKACKGVEPGGGRIVRCLEEHASDPAFQDEFLRVKHRNKERLADLARATTGVALDPESLTLEGIRSEVRIRALETDAKLDFDVLCCSDDRGALDRVMEGDLREILDALYEHDVELRVGERREALLQIGLDDVQALLDAGEDGSHQDGDERGGLGWSGERGAAETGRGCELLSAGVCLGGPGWGC